MKRDKIAQKVEKALEERKVAEENYYKKKERAMNKNGYITSLISARFHTARTNMIVDQIKADQIMENIDGAPKTKEFMLAEYMVSKMRAIKDFREAYFHKESLKKLGMTDKEIEDLEKDFYEGQIIRDVYPDDDFDRTKGKAEFVKE